MVWEGPDGVKPVSPYPDFQGGTPRGDVVLFESAMPRAQYVRWVDFDTEYLLLRRTGAGPAGSAVEMGFEPVPAVLTRHVVERFASAGPSNALQRLCAFGSCAPSAIARPDQLLAHLVQDLTGERPGRFVLYRKPRNRLGTPVWHVQTNSEGNTDIPLLAAATPDEPPEAATEEFTFVAIRLVDEEGKPISGEKYEITLPDGSVRNGTLDENGFAQEDDLPPGTCEFTFPEFDEAAWGY